MPPLSKRVNYFLQLSEKAEAKSIDIVLPLHGRGGSAGLIVEARVGQKVIDAEKVKSGETVNHAAYRLGSRMRKDKLID
jgi:hypothetical protein